MQSLTHSRFTRGYGQAEAGSALIIALVTLAVLSFAAAAISVSVSSTANVSLQAATWQEAIMAAEAGADTAMACFRVALDEGSQNPTLWNNTANALSDTKSGATAWPSAAPPSGITTADAKGWSVPSGYSSTQKLSMSPVFRSAVNGNTGLQATVSIEAPGGWTAPNGQWYRIRSTGIAGISGPPRVGADKRDSDLRKISLMNARLSRSGFLAPPSLNTAQVTRSIELIIKPLPKGLWDRAITSGSSINMGAKFIVDSYNSTDASKSTNGYYDSAKAQSNANVASDDIGSKVKIGGATIMGNLTYNTGTATGTSNVSGTITNTFYQQLVDIQAPSWSSYNFSPSVVINGAGTTTLNGGSANNPARYVLSGIGLQGGDVLTFQNSGAGKYVEIYVTKDVSISQTGQIIIPDGYNVKFYIAGKFSVSGGGFVNQTIGANAATALSLYGIAPGDSTTPQWQYGSTSSFTGTIYGPEVQFKVTGASNFYGAVLCNTVDFGGGTGAGFHFDEALLKGGSTGTPRYQVASWMEDVR